MEETKKKKIGHDYVCDICGKPAKYNIQSYGHEYEISKSGDFKEIDLFEVCDFNEFYCQECYDKR